MSNTRRAAPGSPLKQHRYASSAEIERGLLANLVAQRCSVIRDAADRELIWFIQLLSHSAAGLSGLAAAVLQNYADRIGTSAMRKTGKRTGQHYSADQVRAVRSDLPESERKQFLLRGEPAPEDFLSAIARPEKSWQRPAMAKQTDTFPITYPVEAFDSLCRNQSHQLEEDLKKLCLDPAFSMKSGPWWFAELVPCLRDYMTKWIETRRAETVTTELGRIVSEDLDYALESKCLVLLEGFARTGKTFAAESWCAQRPGKTRYIQVPSTNDEIGFFRAIAKALGVSSGLSWKAVQLRERIEDVLQAGDLMIVFDEAHYLWPVTDYRYAQPGRINWIMTALVNHHVAVGLVTTPQFIRTQKVVETRTNWTSEQFIGRIGHYRKLPDSLSESDLEKVAQAMLPEGDDKSIEILVRYAQGSAKYLAGIESVVRRARYLAGREQRDRVTRADIKCAIQESVIPSDSALAGALADSGSRNGKRRLKTHFEPLNDRPEGRSETNFAERESADQAGSNRLNSTRAVGVLVPN